MTTYRLAVVTSHPIQYQAPLFRLLAQHPQIDLTVYFGHDASLNNAIDVGFGVPVTWDVPLLSGYRSIILRENSTTFDADSAWHAHARLVPQFRQHRYDAVLIHGYAYSLSRWAFIAAWLSQTPILLHGESEIFAPRTWLKRLARTLYLLPFLYSTRAVLTIGQANRAFYSAHHFRPNRMFQTPYAVDNVFFQSERDRLLTQREALRAEWGFQPNQPVILFAGKLIERKRPLDLLAAYRKVLAAGYEAGLLYVGDGELRTALENQIAEHSLSNVKISGFINQSEISAAYICGDLFVLPSRYETWGLVVNEAMNFGMPVVVSDQVGAHFDLVREGKTGYVFPVGQSDDLATVLIRLLADTEHRQTMGRQALALVGQYNFQADVNGIVQALQVI